MDGHENLAFKLHNLVIGFHGCDAYIIDKQSSVLTIGRFFYAPKRMWRLQ